MDDFNAGVGGAASTEGGGMSEIRQKRIGSKAKRWGRWGSHNLQPWGPSTAADSRESGEHDNSGTLGEPPPPPPLCLPPNLFMSDLRCLSSFSAGQSTHTGVEVSHYPLSAFFWSPPNSASAPDSTSSISAVLQECRNTCTCLWIQSIRSDPKRGSLAKAFSYCRPKQSM